MSTLYASFSNSQPAQLAMREILSDGISSDYISLLARDGLPTTPSAGHLEDASYIVGRSDDPLAGDLNFANTNPLHELQESEWGGGISTSDPSDDVSGIEELDDSQEVADRESYALNDRPHSRGEVDEIQTTLATGFPTDMPVIDPVTDAPQPSNFEIADSVDRVSVPGFAVVLGGGALATAALEIEPKKSRHALATFLADEGVPGERAQSMLDEFEDGGAVLAIEIVPGEVNPDRVAAIAERFGAIESHLYDAPRY